MTSADAGKNLKLCKHCSQKETRFLWILSDVRNSTNGTEEWEFENIERKNEFKQKLYVE
jgi:hypothetical protein